MQRPSDERAVKRPLSDVHDCPGAFSGTKDGQRRRGMQVVSNPLRRLGQCCVVPSTAFSLAVESWRQIGVARFAAAQAQVPIPGPLSLSACPAEICGRPALAGA